MANLPCSSCAVCNSSLSTVFAEPFSTTVPCVLASAGIISIRAVVGLAAHSYFRIQPPARSQEDQAARDPGQGLVKRQLLSSRPANRMIAKREQ